MPNVTGQGSSCHFLRTISGVSRVGLDLAMAQCATAVEAARPRPGAKLVLFWDQTRSGASP